MNKPIRTSSIALTLGFALLNAAILLSTTIAVAANSPASEQTASERTARFTVVQLPEAVGRALDSMPPLDDAVFAKHNMAPLATLRNYVQAAATIAAWKDSRVIPTDDSIKSIKVSPPNPTYPSDVITISDLDRIQAGSTFGVKVVKVGRHESTLSLWAPDKQGRYTTGTLIQREGNKVARVDFKPDETASGTHLIHSRLTEGGRVKHESSSLLEPKGVRTRPQKPASERHIRRPPSSKQQWRVIGSPGRSD